MVEQQRPVEGIRVVVVDRRPLLEGQVVAIAVVGVEADEGQVGFADEAGQAFGHRRLPAAASARDAHEERASPMPALRSGRARRRGQRGSARTVARSGSPSTTDAARNPASAACSSQVGGRGRRRRPSPSCRPPRRRSAPGSGGLAGVDDLAHLGRLGEAVGVVQVGLQGPGALAALAVRPLHQSPRHRGGGAGAGQHLGGDQVRRTVGLAHVGGFEELEGGGIAGREGGRGAEVRVGGAAQARRQALRPWPASPSRRAAHARWVTRSGSWSAIDGPDGGGGRPRGGIDPDDASPTGVRPGSGSGRLDLEDVDVGAGPCRPDLLVVVEGEEQREEGAVALVADEEPDRRRRSRSRSTGGAPGRSRTARR